MPEKIDLYALDVDPDALKGLVPEEGIGAGDVGRAVLSGTIGLGSSLMGAAEYVTGAEPDSALGRGRRALAGYADDQVKAMSPRAQRAMNAGFLPDDEGGDIFDEDVSATGALTLKLASSLPSLLLTIVPAGVAARAALAVGAARGTAAAVGTTVGSTAGGAQMGGDVFADIVDGLEKTPDAKLREESQFYDQLRQTYDEPTARKALTDEAVGNRPYIMGALGAALEHVGAGSAVAKRVAGIEGRGAVRSALKTGKEEAVTETAQNTLQEGLRQGGNIEVGAQQDFDARKLGNAAVEGAVLGGVMGAGVGGVTGRRRSTVTVQPATEADPAEAAAVTADTAPATTPRDAAQKGLDDAGAMLDANQAAINAAAPTRGDAIKARRKARVIKNPSETAEAAAIVAGADSQEQVAAVTNETVPAPSVVEPEPFVAQNEYEDDPDAPLPSEVTPDRQERRAQSFTDGLAAAGIAKAAPAPEPEAQPATPYERAVALVRQDNKGSTSYIQRKLGLGYNAASKIMQQMEAEGIVGPMDTKGRREVLPVAQDAPPAATEPAPVAEAQPELPAAGGPSEATTGPIGEVVDLYALPEVPAQPLPRVLQSDVSLKAEPVRAPAPKLDQRISKAERARIAAGEGDAVALSQNPEDFKKPTDRRRVIKLAAAEEEAAKAAGREVAPWAADVLAARGKMAGNNPRARAAQEQYYRGRQALADLTNERIASGEARRETKDEAEQRKREERAVKDAATVGDILKLAPVSDRALKGLPKAVREHAKLVLDVARKAGVKVPETVTADTDPHLLYLKNAQEVAKDGSSREAQMQFLADDYFLRNGAGEELAARRRVERAKTEQSYDEAPASGSELREGTDKSEEYDAQGASTEVAAETSEVEETADVRPEVPLLPAAGADARPRDKGDTDGPAVVAGTNKAGTFKAEVRKSRAVTSQGKGKTLAQAVRDANRNPTEAQKEAGNYAKGHVTLGGLDISIENPKGAERSGTDANGQKWSVKMPAHYGYVRGTKGADGDHLDVYIGPQAVDKGNVYIVNQNNLDGTFDEHKVMLGFKTEAEALATYKAGFSDGKGAQRIGSVAVQAFEDFKEWSKTPHRGPVQATKGATLKPAARERTADEARMARELEEMFGRSTAETDFDLDDGVTRVVSPRSGVGVVPVQSGSLAEMLSATNVTTMGGANANISVFARNRLQEMVGDTQVHIVSKADMTALTQDMIESGDMRSVPLGYYEPSGGYIVINDAALTSEGALTHLLIHEGMHAAYLEVIARSSSARAVIRDMMDRVTEHTGRTAQNTYGLTNEDEFVSEAFSSQSFQELLQTVPAPRGFSKMLGNINNVWNFFIIKLRKALGLPVGQETMLDSALRVGAVLTQLRSELATSRPSTPRALSPAALQTVSQQDVRDGLSDRRAATGGAIKRTVLRVQTLDQIRQNARDLFSYDAEDGTRGSYLDDVVKGMQRQAPFVNARRERGEKFAERFLELARRNPRLAVESAQLRTDITMANINVLPGKVSLAQLAAANPHVFGKNDKSDISGTWQSKALAPGLQERFSNMPEEVQRAILEEARYFRETQNEITRKLVDNIIDTHSGDLTTDERDGLTKRTMAGTLTEEDADLIDNATIFNALKGAREFRVIKGMYFPLMRHGDYVVRTTDAITDTKGGEEVSPGVVEFRGGKDKDVRKQAEAFAKGTDLTHTRTVRVYYDAQTGERIKAADADANSDVAYQVHVQKEGTHFFDSRTQAEAFIREAKANGLHTQVSGTMVRQDIESRGDLHSSQLASIVASIDSRKDIPEGQRAMMRTALAQAAVRLMSGNRIQKKALPRLKVRGASQEYGRNVLAYATSASNYLGKLTYMPDVRNALTAMREMTKDRYTLDATQRDNVLQEVEKRVNQNDVGINTPSKAVRTLFTVTYLSKLFSPAHSIINATQPVMVTYPVLAGTHGSATAAIELSRAMRAVGAFSQYGSGIANTGRAVRDWAKISLDTTDVIGAVKRKVAAEPDGKELNAMLEELRGRGAVDDAAQFELAQAVSAGAGRVGTALAKFDRIARQAPAAVEAVNRAASAIAAYRLARRTRSHEAAVAYAYDVTVNTQGDYSAQNAAPIFNNPIARPFLQFKKYGQMMTHLYVDMLYRAFKGDTREAKLEAVKQFGHLLAVQTLMAGAMSWPTLELLKYGAVLAAALGVGDGWEAQERRLRKLTDEAIGMGWSEMLHKGIVSRALGIDLSTRMSLADMWTFGEPKEYTTSEITAWAGKQYFGAAGGTVMDLLEGSRKAVEGDMLGAAAKVLPIKVGADIVKGIAGAQSDKMNLKDAIVRGVGFTTARQANKSEEVGERIADGRALKRERNSLRNAYIEARPGADRVKAVARIREFNKTANFREKITIKSLDAIRERQRKENAR